MCGRMFQTLPLRRLLQIARTKNATNQEMFSSSYNICPTTYIPVIKKSNLYPEDPKPQKADNGMNQEPQKIEEQEQLLNDRQLTFMKWGQKTNFNMIVNGRIQELHTKRTFMKILENRCVVIMEGYYQWKEKEKPFSFKPKNSDHFLVAGLYTQKNEIVILTKDAVSNISHIHQRMPAILSEAEVELWLDPKNTKNIQQIIKDSICNKEKPLWKNIGFAELAPHVNKREEKSVKCLMTVEQYKKELDKKGLMRFWGKKPNIEKKDKIQVKQGTQQNREEKQNSESEKKDQVTRKQYLISEDKNEAKNLEQKAESPKQQ